MSAGFQQAWYRPPNIKDVSGGSPSGLGLLWVPAAASLTLALCVSELNSMAFWPVGIQQRSEMVTGSRWTRNKEGEVAVCCRQRGLWKSLCALLLQRLLEVVSHQSFIPGTLGFTALQGGDLWPDKHPLSPDATSGECCTWKGSHRWGKW